MLNVTTLSWAIKVGVKNTKGYEIIFTNVKLINSVIFTVQKKLMYLNNIFCDLDSYL